MTTSRTVSVLSRVLTIAAWLLVLHSPSAHGQVVFRASVSEQGQQLIDHSTGRISADGRYVVLTAPSTVFSEISAPYLPGHQVFRRSLSTGIVDIVSRDENGQVIPQATTTYAESINADGSAIAFTSETSTLVSGDTNGFSDVFVRDYNLGTLERASTGWNGQQGDSASYGATLSSDGRFVAFMSGSSNLTAGVTPLRLNVFVKDRQLGSVWMVNVNSAGVPSNAVVPPGCVGWYCDGPKHAIISGNGRFVLFDSIATNLS